MKKANKDNSIKSPQKLQVCFFLHDVLLLVLLFTGITIGVSVYFSKVLLDARKESLAELNRSMLDQTEKGIHDLDGLSANISYSNRKTNFLFHLTANPYTTTDVRYINDNLMSLNGMELAADQINILCSNGNGVECGLISRGVRRAPSEQEWYLSAKVAGGSIVIGSPYYSSRYSAGNAAKDWYLSSLRYSKLPNTDEGYAIETVKRCKIIFQDVLRYENSGNSPAALYIFDKNGKKVFPYNYDARENNLYRTLADSSLEPSGPEKFPEGFDSNYIVTSLDSTYTGWTYLLVQSRAVVYRPIVRMVGILVGILSALLVVALLLSWRMARQMVVPVKHLKHIVQKMRLDTIGKNSFVSSYKVPYEELSELYQEFEQMCRSLQNSLNELEMQRKLEMQARVTALQAQMNPHFYYNTLSCISILAEDGQTDQVSELCQSLSEIMRYITDAGNTNVKIRDEMDYIRKYIHCMKIRYQDSLAFAEDLDPALLDQEVPKLTLQPLIENAIKYGTDCLPPWTITLTGRVTDEGWLVRVEDTGNGFTEEAMQRINSMILEVNNKTFDYSQLRIGHLGLISIYIRWKSFCQGDQIFRFGNLPEGHAYVEIGRKAGDSYTGSRSHAEGKKE
ncbi:MAG: histidine kinase [Eubacterium sp.]|nr:histidine kinase [Eubacterium sp.]